MNLFCIRPAFLLGRFNSCSMLAHRMRRWPNIKPVSCSLGSGTLMTQEAIHGGRPAYITSTADHCPISWGYWYLANINAHFHTFGWGVTGVQTTSRCSWTHWIDLHSQFRPTSSKVYLIYTRNVYMSWVSIISINCHVISGYDLYKETKHTWCVNWWIHVRCAWGNNVLYVLDNGNIIE